MTPPRREQGVPHARRPSTARSAGAGVEETWNGANEAKLEKLRRNDLQRRARNRGLQLRHSAYGYALVDTARKRADDRSDMSLDDVESWLKAADVGRK